MKRSAINLLLVFLFFFLAATLARGEAANPQREQSPSPLKVSFHLPAVSDRAPMAILTHLATYSPYDIGIVSIHRGQTVDDPPLLDTPITIQDGNYTLEGIFAILKKQIPNLSFRAIGDRVILQIGNSTGLDNPLDSKLAQAIHIEGTLSEGLRKLSAELPKIRMEECTLSSCDSKKFDVNFNKGVSVDEAISEMARRANSVWTAHVYENPPNITVQAIWEKEPREYPGSRISIYCGSKRVVNHQNDTEQ